MTGQPWLATTFAVIMIGTAAYCLTRLTVSWRRPTDRHVDGMHVLMGAAMAGMLVPRLRLMWTGGWEIIFAAGAALFAWRMAHAACARWAGAQAVRARGARTRGVRARGLRARNVRGNCQSHHAQHLLGCAAMLYMLAFLAPLPTRMAPPHSAAPGMLGPAAPSALPMVLAVALLGCVVWTADRMATMAPVAELGARESGLTVGPGAAAGSPIATVALPARPVPLSPRLSACCEIATGVTMGYMLITMLT